MKTPKLVLSVLACSVVVGNYAQNIPTHADQRNFYRRR